MRWYWFLLGVLCVWRLTHLVQAEDGPWGLLGRLREAAGGEERFWGRLLGCFYCLSLWVSAPCAWWIGAGLAERLLLWPALSAGAILLLRATERAEVTPPALYHEEPEHVLRKETDLPPDPVQH